ncbi:MAG: hypothetical protein WDW38_010049 [Sanguina aurantia]
MKPATGDEISAPAAIAGHASQLCAFVSNARPALRSITSITITLPHIIGCDTQETNATSTAATAMLLPLATSCPLLEHLSITGRVGCSLLRSFGSACPHLARLDAKLTNLSPTTLQTLSALLPKLTSLAAVPRPPLRMNEYSSVEGTPTEQQLSKTGKPSAPLSPPAPGC